MPNLSKSSSSGSASSTDRSGRLRIEIRQGFDMRYQWVLIGPHGSIAISPHFLRKETCWRALRAVQKDCHADVEDHTFTAPLEAA